MSSLCKIAKQLISSKLLSEYAALNLYEKSQASGSSFVSLLLKENIVESKDLANILAKQFGFSIANLAAHNAASIPWGLLDEFLVLKYRVIPFALTNNELHLALADPTDNLVINEIKFYTQKNIKIFIADYAQINKLIDEYIQAKRCQALGNADVADAPIVKFIDDMIHSAIEKRASDIHFEPYEKFYRIRFRIDGLLQEFTRTDLALSHRICARLKIISRLDIAEKRLPQDGRFNLTIEQDRSYDCRISTCPTMFGEKIVVRILNSTSIDFNVDKLGFDAMQKALFLQHIRRPDGMILVTGPTGSGKTVTLYSALNILNTDEKNISTAEDPIEINLCGINQVEVNKKTGLDFAHILRAFLRQDPDIIMVGEIRDPETAEIAVKAAQTGHLVLATLHTNSAAEAITRLRNLGIAEFNLASSINLVIAQRLVRKLCLNNGYQGRVGIFEMLAINDELREIILSRGSALELANKAKQSGMTDLQSSAFSLVKRGITNKEEISRVLNI